MIAGTNWRFTEEHAHSRLARRLFSGAKAACAPHRAKRGAASSRTPPMPGTGGATWPGAPRLRPRARATRPRAPGRSGGRRREAGENNDGPRVLFSHGGPPVPSWGGADLRPSSAEFFSRAAVSLFQGSGGDWPTPCLNAPCAEALPISRPAGASGPRARRSPRRRGPPRPGRPAPILPPRSSRAARRAPAPASVTFRRRALKRAAGTAAIPPAPPRPAGRRVSGNPRAGSGVLGGFCVNRNWRVLCRN